MLHISLAVLIFATPFTLAQNSTAGLPAHNSKTSHNTTTTERVGFEWGSTDRSTLVLLWSCLTTIFACTWTAVHSNIPHPGASKRKKFFNKLLWMVITVIAPEMTCSNALGQFIACYKFRALMRQRQITDWSLAQSFYARMGGYVLSTHRDRNRILTMAEMEHLIGTSEAPEFIVPSVSKEEVNSFAKADSFAKLVTLIQAGWLIVQSIARQYQHLPISELEIATLAFVANAFLIYLVWWNKPYEAEQCTKVSIDRKVVAVSQLQEDLLYSDYSVPTFGLSGMADFEIDTILIGIAVVGSICGAIHCTAWNFEFPSRIEQLLWRLCSIIVTAMLPVCWVVMRAIMLCLDFGDDPPIKAGKKQQRKLLGAWLSATIQACLLLVYVGARMTLIFLAFYGLRSQPAGVYKSAAWVNFIPHLG
jgi:hypothetical protein